MKKNKRLRSPKQHFSKVVQNTESFDFRTQILHY